MTLPAIAAAFAVAFQDPSTHVPVDAQYEQDAPVLEGEDAESWKIDVHALLKTSYMENDDKDVSGLSYDLARAWLDARAGRWHFHVGIRADEGRKLANVPPQPQPAGDGLGFFGVTKDLGEVRANEAWVQTEVLDNFDLRVGRFRPPMAASSMVPEAGLLMYHRSFIGNDWDFYQDGLMLRGRYKRVRAWFAVQNGSDRLNQDIAMTARGVIDLFGSGVNYNYEGAYGAKTKFACSAGGSIYYDTATNDRSAQVLDFRMTGGELLGVGPFSLSGEYIDKGDGIGELFTWGATASAMLGKDWELGVSFEDFEDFDRVIGADLGRVSLTYFVSGHDAKVQLVYADSNSNAPLVDDETLILGVTLGI